MSPRAVRVVTENAAVDRPFDYGVPTSMSPPSPGERVRVELKGRSLRGWVISEGDSTLAAKELRAWLGWGPPPSMIALLEWAARRWVAPLSRFLLAASPDVIVRELPVAPTSGPPAPEGSTLEVPPGVVVVAPSTDPLALILHAHEETRDVDGSLLVLVPGDAWAQRLAARLARRGLAVAGPDQWDLARAGWPVVVGARGAAFAPTPRLRGAVVIDADDEAFRSTAAPTYDAASVVRERARRDGAPLWLTSFAPSPALWSMGEPTVLADLAGGWPRITVVDRRESDPHDGVLAAATLAACRRALEGPDEVAVAVILQRLGHGRLFACPRCRELALCEVCAQAEIDVEGRLACPQGHQDRERFCRACGATGLRAVRSGISTLARDVSALLGREVGELSAGGPGPAEGVRVVVGTEAVLHRVRRCGVVVFADLDQYLLAPRASARRATLWALGRAGRLVGSRREGRGEVVVQTRRRDQVLEAAIAGDVREVCAQDDETARLLALPPYGGLARVSGPGAADFVATLTTGVRVTRAGEGYEVTARDVEVLTDTLAAAERPHARVRLEVF